jgi:uncharacterized membrane-anchored protein
MTETTTHEADSWDVLLKSAVLFVRLLQVTAGLMATMLLVGALLDGGVLVFLVVALVAGLLLLVILVLEFVAVRGLRRWAA